MICSASSSVVFSIVRMGESLDEDSISTRVREKDFVRHKNRTGA